MDRRLVSGHSPYEGVAGFSRAVVAGDRVHVAGTAPIPPDGSPPPEAAYEQAALCLRIIGEALDRAGSGLECNARGRDTTGITHGEKRIDAHAPGEVLGRSLGRRLRSGSGDVHDSILCLRCGVRLRAGRSGSCQYGAAAGDRENVSACDHCGIVSLSDDGNLDAGSAGTSR